MDGGGDVPQPHLPHSPPNSTALGPAASAGEVGQMQSWNVDHPKEMLYGNRDSWSCLSVCVCVYAQEAETRGSDNLRLAKTNCFWKNLHQLGSLQAKAQANWDIQRPKVSESHDGHGGVDGGVGGWGW